MRTIPSRTFLYLTMIIAVLLVMGLIIVGMLLTKSQTIVGDYFTGTAVLATNSAYIENVTRTWMYFIGETATNLRGFEPSSEYFQTRAAEEQTEVFNVEASLGATNAAIYWATETEFRTKLFETVDAESTFYSMTQTVALPPTT